MSEATQEQVFSIHAETKECSIDGCTNWPQSEWTYWSDYDCKERKRACAVHYCEVEKLTHGGMSKSFDHIAPPLLTTGEAIAYTIGVYEVRREHGGYEEGGWSYESGELYRTYVCTSEADTARLLDDLRVRFPRTMKRNSVNGGEDWEIDVFKGFMPPDAYPEEVPRYA